MSLLLILIAVLAVVTVGAVLYAHAHPTSKEAAVVHSVESRVVDFGALAHLRQLGATKVAVSQVGTAAVPTGTGAEPAPAPEPPTAA